MRKEQWKSVYYSSRWFALGCGLLVVNAAAVFSWMQQESDRGASVDTPGLVDVVPADEAQIDARQPVEWHFSSEMVDGDSVGQWLDHGPVLFDPEVGGQFYWKTPQHLMFLPDASWPVCQQMTMQLKAEVKDLRHRQLPQGGHYAFQTEALRCLDVRQVDLNTRREAVLRLRFNYPVNREALREALQLSKSNGNDLGYDIVGAMDSEEILVKTQRVSDKELILKLKAGLRPATGDRGLERPYTVKLAFAQSLEFNDFKPLVGTPGLCRIRFGTTAALENVHHVKSLIAVEPPVPFSLNKRWSGYELVGAFQAGTGYTLRFKEGITTRNGSKLESEIVRRVHMPDYKPSVSFSAPGRYLSPRGGMRVPLSVVNVPSVDVEAFHVYPNNLVYFVNEHRGSYDRWYSQSGHEGLSHSAGTANIPLRVKRNEPSEVPVDLGLLTGEEGPGVYMLEAQVPDERQRDRQLVVVTDIGISASVSEQNLLVWANGISDLEPLRHARVLVYCDENQVLYEGRTDGEGLALIVRTADTEAHPPSVVVVQQGSDLSYLDLTETAVKGMQETAASRAYLQQGYESFVYTDRGIYRPGETVHVKTLVRDRDGLAPGEMPVEIEVIKPDGRPFKSETGLINGFGTRCVDFELPKYLPTGTYSIQCRLPGADRLLGSTRIALEDFVPPTIRVSAESRPERSSITEPLKAIVTAEYLFGAPAAGLRAEAWVQFRPAYFSQKAWNSYVFGDPEEGMFKGKRVELGATLLDENGRGIFGLEMPRLGPTTAAIEANIGINVTEPSGRTVTTYTQRQIDPTPYYLGVEKSLAERALTVGRAQDWAVVAVRPDGSLNEELESVRWTLDQITWHRVSRLSDNGSYRYETKRELKRLKEGGEIALKHGRGTATFNFEEAGEFLFRVFDGKVSSSMVLRVRGKETFWSNWNAREPGEVSIVADKPEYQPGDTAYLKIESPFSGRAMISLEQNGVTRAWTAALEGNNTEIELPIDAAQAPNVYCSVRVIRAVQQGMKEGIYRASGRISLPVRRPKQALFVTVEAPEHGVPMQPFQTRIHLRDAEGRPVQGEVSLAAVDEAICMLTNYKTPDPLGYFQAERASGVRLFDLYQLLMPELDLARIEGQSAPGGGFALTSSVRLNPVDSHRFNPVALWKGSVQTDANGVADVMLDLPEFSGELRLMAVAVSERAYGAMHQPLKVRRSLVVQHSLPRFLAPGDQAEVPLKLFNQSNNRRLVHYEVNTDGPVTVEPRSGEFWMEPGAQHSLHLGLRASTGAGLSRLAFDVRSGEDHYQETIELAVRPPAPRDTVHIAGVVQPGESIDLKWQQEWLEGTEEVELLCSHRPDLDLGESLDGLLRYPYGCLEQTTSGAFPQLYLSDLMEHVRPDSSDPEQVKRNVQAGIYRILSMQHRNGHFAYWPRSEELYPYGSVYATHFLVEAQKRDYFVPEAQLQGSLHAMEKSVKEKVPVFEAEHPRPWHHEMARRTYAAFVLALAGRPNYGVLSRLEEFSGEMKIDARVRLIAAYAVSGQRKEAMQMLKALGWGQGLHNVVETSGSLSNPAVELALLIEAWLEMDPDQPELGSLVSRLNQLKQQGQWYNTHGNALALMALGKYARQVSVDGPKDYQAEIGSDEGVRRFDHTRKQGFALSGKQGTLTNQGPGALYYSLRSSGVPAGGEIAATDRGLRVRSTLLDINGAPLQRSKLGQGELVVARISIDPMGQSLDNLAVEQLLPAGLEIENARLATSQIVDWIGESSFPLRSMDQRDDRLVLFPGVIAKQSTFHVALRAVTKGTWVFPPVLAESMYDGGLRSVHRGMKSIEVVDAEVQPPAQRANKPEEQAVIRPRPVVSDTLQQAFEYVVQPGDSLQAISLAFIVSLEDLRALNNQVDSIKVGDVLAIPPSVF